jgi:hypothetical protein
VEFRVFAYELVDADEAEGANIVADGPAKGKSGTGEACASGTGDLLCEDLCIISPDRRVALSKSGSKGPIEDL